MCARQCLCSLCVQGVFVFLRTSWCPQVLRPGRHTMRAQLRALVPCSPLWVFFSLSNALSKAVTTAKNFTV